MRTPPVGYPLRDLRNCIVFSQHGDQDLPSQLSGGDLNGDQYNIIWDRQACPKRFFASADYSRITPTELNRQVTRDGKAGFFVDFMKSDMLGMITTEHLI
ncbi:RNA-dependent RNA polymerase [Verticillium alfalfae VaMs.102]|uniref:RNA-dependent RNA polymerase n=1 Tax=Verticillium alfalfae (strain VaMs.102 / ATCC MYA-4576 / FGSC 10136) TaxID=526221 RepID=C9SLL4_VERA1|nr:RNA-dependent RNA polymerase [Verticillium alfalfae VaMs.102]EEY19582.1 RNA-dependent RNA polymerase [Verticillium alfalfae VaMs.102]